jgi:hypothetical protein
MRYLSTGTYDSVSPATLAFGEFSDQGLYDPWDVRVVSSDLEMDPEQPSITRGSMTCVATASLDDPIDAFGRTVTR